MYETRKIKHNCVKIGVFSEYNGQLHVSACTGHLQVVLGELNLRSYYKHSARTWCRDLYIRALFATSKATLCQLLAYGNDVNILGGSIHTLKENADALVAATREIGLEVSTWSCREIRMQD